MKENFLKHSSNIGKSADEFLKSLDYSEKTMRTYEEILFLFIDSLSNDPSAVEERPDGEYVLKHDWNVYWGAAVDNFIDWWIPRKVICGDELQQRAPGIMKKWITWCFEEGYLDQDHFDEFMESFPKNKASEIKRLQKLSDLFYRLHSPNPGAWMNGEQDSVVNLDTRREPEDWAEGYFVFDRKKNSGAFFIHEDIKIGPILVSTEILGLLKKGDTVNLNIGKFEKNWKVLESGNVYAEGTFLA